MESSREKSELTEEPEIRNKRGSLTRSNSLSSIDSRSTRGDHFPAQYKIGLELIGSHGIDLGIEFANLISDLQRIKIRHEMLQVITSSGALDSGSSGELNPAKLTPQMRTKSQYLKKRKDSKGFMMRKPSHHNLKSSEKKNTLVDTEEYKEYVKKRREDIITFLQILAEIDILAGRRGYDFKMFIMEELSQLHTFMRRAIRTEDINFLKELGEGEKLPLMLMESMKNRNCTPERLYEYAHLFYSIKKTKTFQKTMKKLGSMIIPTRRDRKKSLKPTERVPLQTKLELLQSLNKKIATLEAVQTNKFRFYPGQGEERVKIKLYKALTSSIQCSISILKTPGLKPKDEEYAKSTLREALIKKNDVLIELPKIKEILRKESRNFDLARVLMQQIDFTSINKISFKPEDELPALKEQIKNLNIKFGKSTSRKSISSKKKYTLEILGGNNFWVVMIIDNDSLAKVLMRPVDLYSDNLLTNTNSPEQTRYLFPPCSEIAPLSFITQAYGLGGGTIHPTGTDEVLFRYYQFSEVLEMTKDKKGKNLKQKFTELHANFEETFSTIPEISNHLETVTEKIETEVNGKKAFVDTQTLKIKSQQVNKLKEDTKDLLEKSHKYLQTKGVSDKTESELTSQEQLFVNQLLTLQIHLIHYFRQTLQCLHTLDKNQLCFPDLKPENIMLANSDSEKRSIIEGDAIKLSDIKSLIDVSNNEDFLMVVTNVLTTEVYQLSKSTREDLKERMVNLKTLQYETMLTMFYTLLVNQLFPQINWLYIPPQQKGDRIRLESLIMNYILNADKLEDIKKFITTHTSYQAKYNSTSSGTKEKIVKDYNDLINDLEIIAFKAQLLFSDATPFGKVLKALYTELCESVETETSKYTELKAILKDEKLQNDLAKFEGFLLEQEVKSPSSEAKFQMS